MKPLRYTKTARGHRDFTIGDVPYRGFWSDAHYWLIYPIGADDRPDWSARLKFNNWREVEAYAERKGNS